MILHVQNMRYEEKFSSTCTLKERLETTFEKTPQILNVLLREGSFWDPFNKKLVSGETVLYTLLPKEEDKKVLSLLYKSIFPPTTSRVLVNQKRNRIQSMKFDKDFLLQKVEQIKNNKGREVKLFFFIFFYFFLF